MIYDKNCRYVVRDMLPAAILIGVILTITAAAEERVPQQSAPDATAATVVVQRDLPSLDDLLARAMEHHPDIVTAKAKLTLAEAELRGKQIEVSRQIIQMHKEIKQLDYTLTSKGSDAKSLRAELEGLKERLGRITSVSPKELLSAGDREQVSRLPEEIAHKESTVKSLEEWLSKVRGDRAQQENELRFMVGEQSSKSPTMWPLQPIVRQSPDGPLVDKIKSALNQNINLHFDGVPLAEVANYLTENRGIRCAIQTSMLESSGLDANQIPVTIKIGDVAFRAGLQALEDLLPGDLQFVVRDYGILLTTKEEAAKRGYVPATSFGL